jgi:hypothetical protein
MKSFVLSLSIAMLLCGSAMAQEKEHGTCTGECPLTATSVASDDDQEAKGCPIEAAMAKLPAMAFKVGDEDACCAGSAEALAESTGKPITYVVMEKKFDSKEDAYVALVEETEKFVTKFTTPGKCEESGATTIAGKSCACPVQGEQTVAAVKSAVDSVAMSYEVGEKTCSCPVEAKKLASDSGESTVFVVAGEKTNCEMTARLNLARAKYKAAVEALVKMEQPETTIQ